MEQSSRISDTFRVKGQGIQFTVYLGKSFIVYDKLREWFVPSVQSPPQILETRTHMRGKTDLYGIPEIQCCNCHWA